MNSRRHIRGALLAIVAGVAPGQAELGQQPNSVSSPPEEGVVVKTDQQSAVRVVDDPHSGMRWTLVADLAHPGGPGRWEPDLENSAISPGLRGRGKTRSCASPLIRAGDRVLVEEHTAAVDVALEAIALEDAASGAPLRVRLKVGEHIVRTIAVGPGRSTLASEEDKRP